MARKKTDMKLAKKVGNNIFFAMQNKCLTKHKLATIVGVSQQSITHFITGKGLPSVSTLLRISDALNVSLQFLTT